MPGSTRRIGNRDQPLSKGADVSPKTVKSSDPAELAFAKLLDRALLLLDLTPASLGADGVIAVIVVPTPDWTSVAGNVWRSQIRDEDGWRNVNEDFSRRREWFALAQDESPRQVELKRAAEKFADAVMEGQHCASFSPERTWLPGDILDCADYTIEVPVLTGEDVSALARDLCGDEPLLALSPEHAKALSPRMLRLSRRPGQLADDFVSRLQAFSSRQVSDPAATRKASPRMMPTLQRLHGMDEAVAWGLAFCTDLAAFKAGKLPWSDVDQGCLLSGPPGSGKTLFAQALAATCDVPLIPGSHGEWQSAGHLGDMLKAMRRTFADARSSAPCVLFIDEVDSFPDRATLTHHNADYEIQIVNALLSEIDGIESREGVLLLAACNYPEKLDPALVRSGRLDRHIRIRPPTRDALALILREHLGTDLAGADLATPALRALGSSGADCERFVRGARRRARTASRTMLLDDLISEISGEEADEASRYLAAVHEAGHALALFVHQPGTPRSNRSAV